MRRYPRLDANQPEIVDALRKVGASVQSLASVGSGVPDLLVGYRGAWFVMEVKDGAKPPSKQALTPDEKEWHESAGAVVHVVNSVERALAVISGVWLYAERGRRST